MRDGRSSAGLRLESDCVLPMCSNPTRHFPFGMDVLEFQTRQTDMVAHLTVMLLTFRAGKRSALGPRLSSETAHKSCFRPSDALNPPSQTLCNDGSGQ